MQCPYEPTCKECPSDGKACVECSNNKEGLKFDYNKPRWDLLPLDPIKEVVNALTYGAQKYGPENWRNVKNARSRYYSALMRHVVAWEAGEALDFESGISHIAHAICNLIFLYELEKNNVE
jgi:hypothetical protein